MLNVWSFGVSCLSYKVWVMLSHLTETFGTFLHQETFIRKHSLCKTLPCPVVTDEAHLWVSWQLLGKYGSATGVNPPLKGSLTYFGLLNEWSSYQVLLWKHISMNYSLKNYDTICLSNLYFHPLCRHRTSLLFVQWTWCQLPKSVKCIQYKVKSGGLSTKPLTTLTSSKPL